MNNEIWKINWSGGKDSTAATILHYLRGDICIVVCYIPMLTDSIPMIHKTHYDFIINTKSVFRSWGFDVKIVTGKTYYDHTHYIVTRGKRKGLIYGTGLGLGFCKFRDLSKIPALNSVEKNWDFADIGIAFDETKRQNQLNNTMRSILCEMEYTEQDAKNLCIRFGMLSPLYETCKRDGCTICPNNKESDFVSWLREYPDAIPILLEIENDTKQLYGDKYCPYRNYEWFSDRMKRGGLI